ncbi:MAG: hypothetical protein H0U08_01030 [Actinobacteria bacterium]|nr:hypothetical protein [Actinomycetota bacterium]
MLNAESAERTLALTTVGPHGRGSCRDERMLGRKFSVTAFAFGPAVHARSGPEGDQAGGSGQGTGGGPDTGDPIAHCQIRLDAQSITPLPPAIPVPRSTAYTTATEEEE